MEPKEVYNLREFLLAYGMSKGTYFKLLRQGRAPKRMIINKKILMTKDAVKEWVKFMEDTTTQII